MKKIQHVLLEKARTYARFTGDLSPRNCRYDIALGAWVTEDDGSLLVERPERPRPQTKKEDIETGEDQKSE